MRSSLSFLRIVIWIVALAVVPTAAQFGLAQKKDANKIQELLLLEEQQQQQQQEDNHQVANMLLHVANQDSKILSEQNAAELAIILKQAAKDPDTQELIARMRIEERETLQQLKETATVQDVMLGLVQVLEEMKMLEVVFEDQERALRLMTEEGMVDPSRIKEYQTNPALLEDDTRKGMYFSFCTLAVTAGFL